MDEFESYFTMFRLRKIWRSRKNRLHIRMKVRGSGWKGGVMFGSYWWIETEFDGGHTFVEFDAFMHDRKHWATVSRNERETDRWSN